MPLPLHRHQLVRMSGPAWRRVLEGCWDEQAHACLLHWAAHDLPLVVTRQSGLPSYTLLRDTINLGLAAPLRWARRRIALVIPRAELLGFDQFPELQALAGHLPAHSRNAWHELCRRLAACSTQAHVYGSYGWQALSGFEYVHATSDLDVWLPVTDQTHADKVAAQLHGFDDAAGPRLDGELLFPSGRAVAWREWLLWRKGQRATMLVKTLEGPLISSAALS